MTLKKLTFKSLSLGLGILFFIAGCVSGNKEPGKETADSMKKDTASEGFTKAKKVFYSLPSPAESAMMLKRAGAVYDEKILNPVDNAGKYVSRKSMALNLGIFICDLSYTSLFEKTQISLRYMNAAKKLADGLGIPDAINDDIIKRIEANQNNKEEIMNIISETFMNSNSYLSPEVASVVVVGGWVEGMYLATQLVDKKSLVKNELANRIIDQHLTMETVITLLDKYKGNDDILSLAKDLSDLKLEFDKIKINAPAVVAEKNEKNNVTTLKSKSEVTVTPEVFESICKKIETIRNSYIK